MNKPDWSRDLTISMIWFLSSFEIINVFIPDPTNLSIFVILDSWAFDYFLLVVELFPKALPIFETGVLVNNNLCGKLFSSSESWITFDGRFKVTWVPTFISEFNLFSCELNNFLLF